MTLNIVLILSLILLFLELNRGFRFGNIITIQVVILASFLLFLILPPVLNQSEIAVSNNYDIFYCFALLGLFFACRIIPYDIFRNESIVYQVRNKWSKLGFRIFIIYLIIDGASIVIQKGSITNVLFASRLEFDEISDTGNLAGRLIVLFKFLFYIHIYKTYYKKKRHLKFIFFYIIPMLHLLITAITRFDFLSLVLILAILYSEPYLTRAKGISISIFVLLIIPTMIFISSYMYFSNILRHGLILDNRIDSINLVNTDYTKDAPYYYLAKDLYNSHDRGEISYEYGMSWFVYPLVSLVPRVIWDSKPSTSFSNRYTEKLYYEKGEGPVATFTIFGEGYIQFGYLGVLLAPILFVKMRMINIVLFNKIKDSKLIIYLIIFSMITYFRAELPTVYVIMDLIFAYIIITFMSVKIKKSVKIKN